ncbi:hypothetical protein [Massilia terrae]|uniref:Uncharacterized protein n=1 Tax=Massilia terrae TaxID=1811224 RepID=A0ABT2D1A5_9BURK|nr:hypothetical protein [Massilia terrae]MCS0660015.1 hypothetical protein [Massilia terrae]
MASFKSPPRSSMAIRKQKGRANKSIPTISAILLVRCSETIRLQNRLMTFGFSMDMAWVLLDEFSLRMGRAMDFVVR